MNELEPTWGRVLSVCWLILWRGTLGAVLMGGIVGFIFGFVAAIMGASEQTMAMVTIAAAVVGGLIGLLWYVIVTRMALRKRYGGFRIVLVPPAGVSPSPQT